MSIGSRDKSLREKCPSPRSLKWKIDLIIGWTHEGVWKGETQQGSVSVFCELFHEHTWWQILDVWARLRRWMVPFSPASLMLNPPEPSFVLWFANGVFILCTNSHLLSSIHFPRRSSVLSKVSFMGSVVVSISGPVWNKKQGTPCYIAIKNDRTILARSHAKMQGPLNAAGQLCWRRQPSPLSGCVFHS